MSITKDRPIVQDPESFAELAQKLVLSFKVKHFSDKEIANYKKTNLFRNSTSLNVKLCGPFLWMGFNCLKFLPFSSQEFLVLILSTSEG